MLPSNYLIPTRLTKLISKVGDRNQIAFSYLVAEQSGICVIAKILSYISIIQGKWRKSTFRWNGYQLYTAVSARLIIRLLWVAKSWHLGFLVE